MNLLLDSHVLLWALEAPERLVDEARDAIASPANRVAVSAACVWELAIKQALGKLRLPTEFLAGIAAASFTPLSVTLEHAFAAGALPRHHDDPFDRMLVAQAQLEGLTIVTRDPALRRYEVTILGA